MTLARTVADVLNDHVTFEVECIDRMYLNVYVPQLQHAGALLGYVQRHLGLPIASTAPLAKITDRFVAAVHRFAEDEAIPWVDFAKGQLAILPNPFTDADRDAGYCYECSIWQAEFSL